MPRILERSLALVPVLAAAILLPSIAASGCSSGNTTATGGSASSTSGSSSSGSSGTSSSTTSSSSSSGTGGASSTSSSSGSGGTDGGGTGGSDGGTGTGWPTCNTPPAGVPVKTLHDIWVDDPAQLTAAWVPGVFVTAVSKGACVAGTPCQIFVQQAETFASLAAGSQQALKIFVSGAAAQYFTTIKVGDKVDVYAWAERDATTNELLLEVNLQYPGCAKTVGTGAPVPVVVTLDDLSVSAYEQTLGPLFVEVDGVSGDPQTPPEIFALWKTGTFSDAGIDTVTNLSPYFLPGGVFTTLTTGHVHDFNHLRGVFAVVPIGSPPVKYEVLYPRVEASDVSILKVH
jgi:hypothetical protein